ncbi:DUF6993 domain-containing protein [Microbacterium fluvii]|uniref:DUF6993 domain-containing protein n=1 Tax=Microbacterium fluvii TaxID=415215 RepID=A0ABW2HCA9_9MICO|nr:hypothetical protein [Microbacterium fluvii]MCU4672522.1 hypothetical protein [Microbacterium fluvii]
MPRRPPTRRPIVAVPLLASSVAALLVFGLAACSATPQPTASTAAATPSATASDTPTPTPTPTGPVFVADGTANDNLPLFTAVVAKVWKGDDKVKGRAYINALVKAGFDKSAMQVTEDESTVGNPAESIQFSVRWGDECLVGQVGPATGDPVTVVLPGLAGGACLLGQTRPIDW